MPGPALLIGLGFIVVACAIGLAVWPLLRDDMSRVVANDNRPDVTSITMLVFGSGLVAGIPALGLWLGVTA